MKRLLTLLTVVLAGLTLQAQYIYNDFDDNQNVAFSGWPNTPSVIANPDPSGINTSANVAEFVRSTEQWAHSYAELDGYIDFSTGTVFEVKVWSPIACDVLFKLEDKNNPNVSTEVMGSVSTPNQWVQLSYDFTGAASGTYDKVVIFFDFAATNDNTFYFDDVTGPEFGGGGTGNPVTLPVTFDDPEVTYALVDFGGNFSEIVEDPGNPSNMVAKTIKTAGAEIWAGTTIGGTAGFPEPIPFTMTETVMTVKVWAPAAGIPVRLKVEDSEDPTISVETEDTTTVANGWETLEFDFSNEAPGTAPLNLDNDYNKASIFFNFGSNGADDMYYWDDVYFGNPVGINSFSLLQTGLSPNPASETVTIQADAEVVKVTAINTSGQAVQLQVNGENRADVSRLATGVYALQIETADGSFYTAKLLKK